MAAIDPPAANGHKSEKKSKKEKKEKKRSREEDAEGEERRHKRSKSQGVTNASDDDDAPPGGSQDLSLAPSTRSKPADAANGEPSPEKKRKHKKDKHKKPVDEAEEDGSDAERKEKKEKKDKKKKKSKLQHKEAEEGLEDPFVDAPAEPASGKKEKKSKKSKAKSPEPAAPAAAEASDSDDAMEVDSPAKPTKSTPRAHQPPDAPSKPQFPFYTQTVSLYLPLYPVGWDAPCTAAATQHLEPLVNRYVPDLRGVLLAFRNVAVSEQPGRRHAATSDTERCDLTSVDEYAVGFGYVTVDVDLFVPRRGAWMEGSINLENEGHVGVVCWGKFNASIESSRLPPEWRWVHAGSAEASAYVSDPFTEEAEEEGDGDDAAKTAEDEHGAVRQIHTTGFWVDGSGDKVKGRVRFRIKAFDVGVSGDHGYLSLEGTMLDAAGEAAAVERDAEQERRRRAGRNGGGILSKERRRMPEFSVTKFGEVEDEEDKALRQDVWDHTAPTTEVEGGEKEAFTGISAEEE